MIDQTKNLTTAPKDCAPKYWSALVQVSDTGPPRYIQHELNRPGFWTSTVLMYCRIEPWPGQTATAKGTRILKIK